MFFRPPKKLTSKERVSNLMRSEYLSGIEGESKSMKKRKKKKGQAEEEESAWSGRYRSEIRDALSGWKVLRSDSEASWQVDSHGGTHRCFYTVTFLPGTKHDWSAAVWKPAPLQKLASPYSVWASMWHKSKLSTTIKKCTCTNEAIKWLHIKLWNKMDEISRA